MSSKLMSMVNIICFVDVIYVGVIHPHHHSVATLLMNAGHNVLCEKPISLNPKLAQDMINIAKKNNVFLAEVTWFS